MTDFTKVVDDYNASKIAYDNADEALSSTFTPLVKAKLKGAKTAKDCDIILRWIEHNVPFSSTRVLLMSDVISVKSGLYNE